MRDDLAERLLANVMEWTEEDVARERPVLQAMAAYKYDEYQQFSPGMRFVESLALWLKQFATVEQRQIAYDFIKRRLIFCSSAEMNHFVTLAYPDHIRPLLRRRVASELGYSEWQVAKVVESAAFKIRRRETLFLGLSDGARIDFFRRVNPELTNEQVWQTYEISAGRAEELLRKLSDDTARLSDGSVRVLGTFRTIVVLDDFSASGISYLRKENEQFKGKIAKFVRNLMDPKTDVSELVDPSQVEILVVLYMATEKARQHIENNLRDLLDEYGIPFSVIVIHPLGNDIIVRSGGGEPFEALLDEYYDSSLEDEHTEKGGTDLRYGFAGCGLPLVLSHNTPNNSLYLLWAKTEKVRALFPRFSRHKSEK